MAVRRCPECKTVNRPTVATCECGYIFDAVQAEALGLTHHLDGETLTDQRHYHTHQLTLGYLAVSVGVLLVAVMAVLLAVRSPIVVFPGVGCVLLFRRGITRARKARRELRRLDGADSGLPRAQLRK